MVINFFNINLFCFYRFKELQIQSEDRLRDLTETLREFGPESQHFLSGEFPGSMSTQDMLHNIYIYRKIYKCYDYVQVEKCTTGEVGS